MTVNGSTIREAREQRGLSLAEVARLANTSRRTLRRIEENSDHAPSFPTVLRIAEVLDVTLDEVVNGKPAL